MLKNKGHTNFYECCDLTEKVYLIYLHIQNICMCMEELPMYLVLVQTCICNFDIKERDFIFFFVKVGIKLKVLPT